MNLLDRYEDRIKVQRIETGEDRNPRRCYDGLILYTSVEPCPMCLARIINTGIKKVYYVAPDETGGMSARVDALPPFWRDLAKKQSFQQINCSPLLREIALRLFFNRHKFGSQSHPTPGDQANPGSAK